MNSTAHPSSHRPDRLTSALEGRELLGTTLAAIDQFSSPPDPMRKPSHLSGRPRLGGELLVSRKADDGDVCTYTVRVVEELSNSLFAMRWKMQATTFAQLRRLAPIDDALNAGEVEPANQPAGLASRAPLRSLLEADLYVISHRMPEWTADAHAKLPRAGVGR